MAGRDNPTCDAQDCQQYPALELENVKLDGKPFAVYICEDCLKDMNGGELPECAD